MDRPHASRDDITRAIVGESALAASPGSLAEVFLAEVLPAGRVRGVVAALDHAGLLEAAALAMVSPEELVAASGVASDPGRGWARRLIELCGWVEELRESGRFDRLSTEELRERLRARRGIGPQLADALLLSGLDRPSYPVDRGTYRVLVRHGWVEPEAGYDEARETVERMGAADPATLRAMRAGFERIARRHCRPREARCDECPLQRWLPERGPLMFEVE